MKKVKLHQTQIAKKIFRRFKSTMGMDIRKLNLLERLYKRGVDIDFMVNAKEIPYDHMHRIETNPKLFNFLTGPIIDTAHFSRLSEAEKETLEFLSPQEATTAAKDTLPIAQKIKDFLDKKFGKGKYTFVSIGRSPVMVGRTLECMGVETKYVPISGLHPRYNVDGEMVDNTLSYMILNKYIEYLKSIGLSRQKIKKSDKKFIFYDYTSSGDTLREMKKFFKKRIFFSFLGCKCAFRSLNKDIRQLFTPSGFLGIRHLTTDFSAVSYIDKYLYGSLSATFSHIPKLDYWDANRVFEEIKHFNPSNRVRFFNFNILNLLEKAGLLVQKQS